jgi:hypothetical protein
VVGIQGIAIGFKFHHKRQMQTVSDIIEAAGGVQAVARHLPSKSRTGGSAIDPASTVYKWRKSGIPERHWPLIMRLAKVSIGKIFAANQRLREGPEVQGEAA